MKLIVNETTEIKIHANCKWNSTQIEISESEEYEFTSKGIWRDLTITTDADGYSSFYMKLFDAIKRAKEYKWFSLVGSLSTKRNEYFLIGKNNKIAFEKSGSLLCFANDITGFYWNNSGYITLHITRVK